MGNVSFLVLERNHIDVSISEAVHSVLLNIFYYTFLLLLALLINVISKQWYGTMAVFFFCWLQYDLRLMSSTIGRTLLLPIEHTLFYYDSIFLYAKRPPVSISYAYWIVLFIILYICFSAAIGKKRNQQIKV
jgi:hypothetical protein